VTTVFTAVGFRLSGLLFLLGETQKVKCENCWSKFLCRPFLSDQQH